MITEIEFTLNLKSTKDEALQVKRRMKCDQEMVDNILQTLVDNRTDIAKYQVRPLKLVDDISIPEKDPKGNNKNKICYDDILGNYLIITSNSLSSYFSSFITHKSGRNIIAQIFPMNIVLAMQGGGDIINGSVSINDNAGKLRQFLKNAFIEGVMYVLLAGDHTVVPVRIGWYEPYFSDPYKGPGTDLKDDSHTNSHCVADLYFSDLNTNWNLDGDQYYGEPYIHGETTASGSITYYHDGLNDLYPELYVGRIPFTNGTEITNWVNKVINYETTPFNGNYSALTRVLWTCADEMNFWNTLDQQNYPSYFTSTAYNELPRGGAHFPVPPWSPSAEAIISTLNQGYGFWNIYTHGTPINIAVKTDSFNITTPMFLKAGIFCYDNDPSPGYEQVNGNGLDNITTKSTIIYSTACDNAKFNSPDYPQDCFAKVFLKLVNGGPAFLGNTGSGSITKSTWLNEEFIQSIFNYGHHKIGVAEAVSKINYHQNQMIPRGRLYDFHVEYVHNLFGDPSMKIWTNAPSSSSYASSKSGKKSTIAQSNTNLPKNYTLYQNYPNPFNPTTSIKFDLPEAGYVSIKVFDILGKEVITLKEGVMDAGYNSLEFNAKNLSSGLYAYKIAAGKYSAVKKMNLIR